MSEEIGCQVAECDRKGEKDDLNKVITPDGSMWICNPCCNASKLATRKSR